HTPNPDTTTVDESAQAQITVQLPVTLQKDVIATSIAETQTSQFVPTNPDVAIGEVVTYRVAAQLSEGTQHVLITDTLPAGVVFVDARSSLPGFTPNITVSGNAITADFGTVVNAGNNVVEPFNLGLDIDVRVVDVATNVAGVVLTNQSSVTTTS